MQIEVLSDTKQRFNGVTYYRCGPYFQRKGVRLHRTVWETFNGPIPAGLDVHHINGNKADNNIENLALLEGRAHNSAHSKAVNHDKAITAAREAAKAWHGSEAGFAFHSQLAKNTWANRCAEVYVCTHCGCDFNSRHRYKEDQNRFCGPNCKAAFAREKRRRAM